MTLNKGGIYDFSVMSLAIDFLGQSIYLKALNGGYQDGFFMLTGIFACAMFMGILLGRK